MRKLNGIESKIVVRRNSRTTILLSVLASVIALFKFMLKIAYNSINNWPIELGFLSILIRGAGLFIVSVYFLLVWDIINFIISDLKRNDILDEEYKLFDKISDQKFSLLTKDFKFFLQISFIICLILGLIILAIGEEWKSFIIILFCFVIISYITLKSWYKKSDKNAKKNQISFIVNRLLWAITLTSVFGLGIGSLIISNISYKADINYNNNGIVNIQNIGAFEKTTITIVDSKNNNIYEKKLNKDELLYAQNNVIHVSKLDNGRKIESIVNLSKEDVSWRYKFDLRKLQLDGQQYSIKIVLYKEKSEAQITNTFNITQNGYMFTRNSIESEY
ncbi:hypothetical protein AAAY24_06245 [Faecalibacillus faecis]|uniref:hypothetical protein n=1 Tax=Faecalibacillus faecis TaxID=1982628 RepID=UPI000E49A21D|nr:hypothetical protein [Faecalibacillus faecis]RHH10904.1 hypothetical protein DW226_05825 [Coprobacillus sp. AM18-4LB-d2]